jgi:TetR/AcrR family transcriptional regulator, ethionamide resistance regulator
MPKAQRVEPTRRRRSREEAEREILEAAAALLRDRPLHAVNVSAIMERTTLSRKSFYVYFSDRYELLTRLFTPLRRELDQANALFLAQPTGDLVADTRASLEAIVRFFAGDGGPLVRALHEASAYDEEAARAWHEFNEPVIAAFVAQIHRHIAAGRIPEGIDVEPTVRALVGMNLYCFFDQVVGNPEVDVDAVVASLLTVWARVFLLADPPAPREGFEPPT